MSLLTFKYTKKDGTTSNRVFYPTVTPTKLYGGIDISALEAGDQAGFVLEMEAAKDAYLSKIAEIKNTYDLNYDYRQFDPAKMTDVVEETL